VKPSPMSHHILHLLSPTLRVSVQRRCVSVFNRETGETTRFVPEDIAAVIVATPDCEFSASALRAFSGTRTPVLLCNEKFEPCSIVLPYHRATDVAVLRSQLEWTPEWKEHVWREIIVAKIRAQSRVIPALQSRLSAIAAECEASDSAPAPFESRAARIHWGGMFRAADSPGARREKGTRDGVNGMLDYGYAVVRTLILRSLATHGFIAAIGVGHAMRPCSHALADDLMEPFRPLIDSALLRFLDTEIEPDMKKWCRVAAGVLSAKCRIQGINTTVLASADLCVRRFAERTCNRSDTRPLVFPEQA
jgi:CRISP-associated protein Cas1